ncbi:MAG: AgmX/PglI C-terminal domain-containing protein [Halobacteriovoraceae bacterium]|nr:AgmX/PglI C-terminal domain-containing protein [Halobacteriovoraceae bacterium]MCB9095771.1 AgmX/PglI C-terminal domain-containing protein [Halobacteriovoraceae bacterium]
METPKTAVKTNKLLLTSYRDEFPVIILQGGVVTVGRSESCDVTINNTFLSFVHASFFVKDGQYFISDLDSTNGTFVNEKPVKTKSIQAGDIIRFASVRYEAKAYDEKNVGEVAGGSTHNLLRDSTVIKRLGDDVGPSVRIPPMLDKSSKDKTQITELQTQKFAQQPLSPEDIFPQFEFSEFIFEENVKGEAFDFSNKELSLEMTVLFGNFIFTIDYLNESKRDLNITNIEGIDDTIVLPILDLNGVVPLATIRNGKFYIRDCPLFSCRVFGNEEPINTPFGLNDEYLLSEREFAIYSYNNIQIIIRPTKAPPATKVVPFFEKDKFLFGLIAVTFLVWLLIAIGILFFDPPEKEEDDPELPEKIDRILYKKKKPIVEVDTEIEKPEQNNVLENQKRTKSPNDLNLDQPQKKAGTPQIVTPPDKTQIQRESKPNQDNKIQQETRKVFEMPAPPDMDVPKPKQPVSAKVKATDKVVRTSDTAQKTVSAQSNIQSLKDKFSKYLDNVNTNIVSDSNVKVGQKTITQTGEGSPTKGDPSFLRSQESQSSSLNAKDIGEFGSDNLVSSKVGGVIGFKDTGKKTVVLGSLDPRAIQNVLRRHIPRFAYCYERELERINRDIATTLVLKFTITKTGRVKNYSFTSQNVNFSSGAIRCFARVLTSIRFPSPKGGGIVKVRQPMNLEPKF